MENKKTKIISMIAIIALVLTVITATYAYFQAQTGEGSQTDVKITANTVDTLSFETGSAISLSLDQESFAKGTGNKTGSTFAKAMLTANNKTNSATEHYYLYLNISSNTFTYTQNESTPEILLTIKDGSNNEITSISGLTHTTITDASGASITGFDITNKSELITLFDNREITTTSSKTEEWNVTITYINYDLDQSANAGKSFEAKLIIQKENMPSILSDVCSDGDNLANCITILSQKSVPTLTNIYHHDGTIKSESEFKITLIDDDNNDIETTYPVGTILDANDNSYRYAGGDYQLTSKAVVAGLTLLYGDDKSATNGVINFYCEGSKGYYGGECHVKNSTYTLQYDSSNTQYSTYKQVVEKALSDGYLESEVKNYVCFGSNDSSCPIDNLYRIIGVFNNQIKLIKADYMTTEELGTNGDYLQSANDWDFMYGSYKGSYGDGKKIGVYSWSSNATNTWSTSLLNKTNLNTNFINYLGTELTNKIATTTWKIGGNKENKIMYVIPSEAYQNEIISPNATNSTDSAIEYRAKIGLIYVSDYYYAASPSAWFLDATKGNQGTIRNNWMYMGLGGWTISRNTNFSECVFGLDTLGNVGYGSAIFDNPVRAVFNLESSVTYKSGSGTMRDPILIN